MALAFAGLELGPILGGEMRDARRQIPRATLVSCVLVTTIYICGTLALLIALPAGTIDAIAGIPQALAAVGARIGIPQFGAVTAFLMTLASIGAISAWISGTTRLPFVVGVDRYLPAAWRGCTRCTARRTCALLVQGVICTLVLLVAVSGSTIKEAFVILLDMTIITCYCLCCTSSPRTRSCVIAPPAEMRASLCRPVARRSAGWPDSPALPRPHWRSSPR